MINLDEIEKALSLERFGRYVEWARDDRNRALELYILNTHLSETLYVPLQMLEVVLRNRIHAVMTEVRHEMWFMDNGVLVIDHQKEQLTKALADFNRNSKEITAGRVVSAMTFSFWTSMVSPDYEDIWQTTLNPIARRQNGKGLRRKDLASPLAQIRTLRNRIAHHEPILQWDLPKHYTNILTITEWLSPAAAELSRTASRFDQVYPAEPIILNWNNKP
ncbi:MAG: Abi family protein [Rhodospirillaceae bacterium]